MFHGLGDACIMPGDIQFDGMIKKGTGAYVRCIEVGFPSLGEVFNNFETIAKKSCEKVAADAHFQGEFNVIGLSQGGLLARYIAEECDMPGKVRNIVTLGGPHMGVEAVPGCFTGFACNILNGLVKKLVYWSPAQNWIAPAGYFRDVANIKGYLKGSVFLPALNNEHQAPEYQGTIPNNFAALRASRFSSVNAAMFVMFDADTVIYPKQTAWFQALDTKGSLVPLKSSDFYLKDYIGLKALMDANKVQFETFAGDHLQFTEKDINETIIPFLLK
jgi:palmitoyl-protein thioesterase